jgi:cell wall-associated NlpC family hydrolase
MTELELRDAIVAEALTWAGTPYRDHAGLKGFGVDCAFLPFNIYRSVCLIQPDIVIPYYSKQQWLNRPGMDMRKESDTTYLDFVLKLAKKEISEGEVQPGDFVLYKVVNSWTHGGVVITWPDYVLHPLIDRGVIGSHGTKEGFLKNRPRRFFTMV